MFGSAKSFDETEAWIGKELVDEPQPGVDVVEAGWIRRRCETLELSCPIHLDEKAAKEAGFDGVVAPDTMIWTFLQPAYWKAGDPETKKDDPPKFPPMVMLNVPSTFLLDSNHSSCPPTRLV